MGQLKFVPVKMGWIKTLVDLVVVNIVMHRLLNLTPLIFKSYG